MWVKTELQKVEGYLQKLFKNQGITLKEPFSKDAPAEVSLGGEFIAVIYKNEDEGEISYDLNMSILPEDIE
ncbi:MAG: DUF3126 family protein [Alphaproteobacteria bacterium]|nr:DUF3126 family protein [Alphaproteobacteria bacterium]